MRTVFYLLLLCCLLSACSVSKKIHQSAQKIILQDSALLTAHVGISIYEPATGKWWYNWQGDKYFVPASNVKLATCYAAMKYLGDSLVGIRYKRIGDVLSIKPSGDPTFLHPDFPDQPVLQLLRNSGTEINVQYNNSVPAWGSGWSWSDYDQAYMPERSSFPAFGNVVWINGRYPSSFTKSTGVDTVISVAGKSFQLLPKYFAAKVAIDSGAGIQRKQGENQFYIENTSAAAQIPFITDNNFTAFSILSQFLQKRITWDSVSVNGSKDTVLHSQPTDSMLKPMMHHSDNFFAEQALIMVSNEVLGYMSEEKLIDTILKTDFKDLPHRPRWADGSGLSRYNLFTPQDFVVILRKIKDEFGMDRVRVLFPSGGEGTLSNFYRADRPFLYAKTGTLSGVLALSGYLTTAQGRGLIVSALINNHRSGALKIRGLVEKFLQNLRDRY